jgi:hypothetical protein
MKTTDKVYFLSDEGKPVSRCVTSIGEIIKVVFELHPEASSILIDINGFPDGFGMLTFYDWENDCDITYQIETIELLI